MHQQERNLLKWLRSNNFRNPSKQEKQLIAKQLGWGKERISIWINTLRYEFSESHDVPPDKARIIKEWVSSNDQRLDPSDHKVEDLRQRTGLSSIQIFKSIQEEQEEIFKAEQPQHDDQNNPQRNQKREVKSIGHRAAIQEGIDNDDLDDKAANNHQSGSLPHTPTGTDFTFDSNAIFPKPFTNFTQRLPQLQGYDRLWTISNIKTEVGRYIQSYHGVVPQSIPFNGVFTLILTHRMMAFTIPEILSITQPQSLQSSEEIYPEFVFPLAPFPPAIKNMTSKILDCRNGVKYPCLYCDKSYSAGFDLVQHLRLHTLPFYTCTVVYCRAYIGEFRMTYQ
jgi:hypothetical protein